MTRAGPDLAPLPTARTEVAGALWEGRIVVVGGLTEAGVASDRVDVYDPAANRWDRGAVAPASASTTSGWRPSATGCTWPAATTTATPAAPWEAQSRVLSLGPGERTWREEAPLAEPRGGLALAAVGDRLVAVGGTGAAGVLRRTEVLVPGSTDGGWRPGPDLAEPRDHLAAASSGGRVYAIAGRQGSLESNLATVESWDPAAADGWRPEPRLNDTRGGTSASEVDGRPCVAGGEEPRGTIASVECLVDGRGGNGWRPSASPATAWPSSASGTDCTSSAAVPSPASSSAPPTRSSTSADARPRPVAARRAPVAEPIPGWQHWMRMGPPVCDHAGTTTGIVRRRGLPPAPVLLMA